MGLRWHSTPCGSTSAPSACSSCSPSCSHPWLQYNPGDFLIDVTSMDYRSPELEVSTRERCVHG